jgi:hypothetical protein
MCLRPPRSTWSTTGTSRPIARIPRSGGARSPRTGDDGIAFGYAAALAIASATALAVSPAFLGTVAAYAAIAPAHSFVLKRCADRRGGARLALRAAGDPGAVAIDAASNGSSAALLLFGSLALFKRQVELAGAIRRGEAPTGALRRAPAPGDRRRRHRAPRRRACWPRMPRAPRRRRTMRSPLLFGLPPVLLLWCAAVVRRAWPGAATRIRSFTRCAIHGHGSRSSRCSCSPARRVSRVRRA